MKREDAAMGWYWAPWMTSWLLVETIRLPVLPRSGPVYKTGASAARPSRNKSGLTRSCTRASPIKSRVYSLTNTLSPERKSLRVVPPHRFLLMREASCC